MIIFAFVFPPSLKYMVESTASENANRSPPADMSIHCFAKELSIMAEKLTAKVMNSKKVYTPTIALTFPNFSFISFSLIMILPSETMTDAVTGSRTESAVHLPQEAKTAPI